MHEVGESLSDMAKTPESSLWQGSGDSILDKQICNSRADMSAFLEAQQKILWHPGVDKAAYQLRAEQGAAAATLGLNSELIGDF
ncbi:hypothetical protein Neosp_000308 [[Neocosmospora] mangrovei]